jgi:prepilin-type N-terminal cleavage/methylation domain-containing protein
MAIRKRAFTLIELLTVIAITAILLGIIFVPVIQSFNITRAAQGFADAQDRARSVISRIEREITNSAGVRDNAGSRGSLYVMLPDSAGTAAPLLLPYVKLDIQLPAQGDPGSRVGTAYIDPDTGKVDPTLTAPKGQVRLPGVPGGTIVRYFICRRDPFTAYNNPWVQYERPGGAKWLAANSNQDNLYVLMRAEVQPYVYETIAGVPTRVVNSRYFLDLDRDASPETSGPLYDDPFFMDPLAQTALGVPDAIPYSVAAPYDVANGTTRSRLIQNWLQKATIVTEVSRYDMIMPNLNKATNEVLFTGNLPSVVPLVRFQPTRLNSEAAEAKLAVRLNEETDSSEKIGPSTYTTQRGMWSDASMRVWPSQMNFGTGALGNSAGAVRNPYVAGPTLDLVENPVVGMTWVASPGGDMFYLDRYLRAKASGGNYPFQAALNPAILANPALLGDFIAMVPNPSTGTVDASFDSREWGTDLSLAFEERIPTNNPTEPGILVGPVVTPANPAYTVAPDWHTYAGINERFARLWHQWDSLWPNVALAPARDDIQGGCKRYFDLRTIDQAGLGSILGLMPRASIVPGSEVIYGPDQTPGPNYGKLVRYSRVPNVGTVTVGPNQYKINYTDRREPDWNADFGFAAPNYDKRNTIPTDFLSSILQARYRAGYVELNSRFGEPIPAGNIYVTYRFQFTEPNDVVSVDYGSSELMEVVLTIRNFPQSNVPPQMVTVRGSAAIRNKMR